MICEPLVILVMKQRHNIQCYSDTMWKCSTILGQRTPVKHVKQQNTFVFVKFLFLL